MRSIVAIALFISGLIQAQNIPNWEFETWHADEYYTLDGYYNYPYNVLRSSNHTEGRYGLRLLNTVNETGSIRRFGYVTNVMTSQGQNGFDFSDDVLAVVFDADYDLAAGDSARVYVRFTEDGATRGTVNFYMWGSTLGQFKTFKIPITWYGPRTPDNVQIYIYSNQYSTPNGNGFITIDDFHFENVGVRKGQIQNFGFEDWNVTGVQYPEYWRSLDLITFQSNKSILGNGSGAVVRSTDAHRGNSALRVGNYDGGSGARGSYVYVGTENIHSYSPAFRLFDRYNYIEGYYQFHSSMQDSGLMILRTFRKGTRIAYTYRYFRPRDQWTYFNVPINYTQDSMPDSASLIFYSYSGTPNDPAAYLLIDDVALVKGASKAGVAPLDDAVRLHPNPTTDLLHLDLIEAFTIRLYDLEGRLLREEELVAGTHSLSLAKLPAGTYFLHCTNLHTQWQTRIMKR